MKRLTSRKIRIPITIVLYQNRKTISRSTLFKKTAIRRRIQVMPWDKAYVKVAYDKDFYNAGFFDSRKSFNEALSAFTEKPLIDFFLEGRE